MQQPQAPKKRKAKSKKPSRAKRRQSSAAALSNAHRLQKWLVLAGTSEAREFITHWAADPNVNLTASLAGVTENAPDLGVQTRIGGFSYHNEDGTLIDGASAMATFVKEGDYAAIIDITHPFAAQISANARAAAERAGIGYFQFVRSAWQPLADDDWHYHDSWADLFKSVKTRHLFVAGGHEALSQLSPQAKANYTARVIEPPAIALSELPENLEIILGLPARSADEEYALFRKLKITAVASKLSGGKASAGKLAAARALGLPVHLVARPDYPEGYFDNLKQLYRALGKSLAATTDSDE